MRFSASAVFFNADSTLQSSSAPSPFAAAWEYGRSCPLPCTAAHGRNRNGRDDDKSQIGKREDDFQRHQRNEDFHPPPFGQRYAVKLFKACHTSFSLSLQREALLIHWVFILCFLKSICQPFLSPSQQKRPSPFFEERRFMCFSFFNRRNPSDAAAKGRFPGYR